MKLTNARVLLVDLFALAVLLLCFWLIACDPWPEAQPEAPKCEEYGVTIEAAPGSGACVFARMRVARFVEVFRNKPGFDVERIRGYVVRVRPGDGGAFESAACSCMAEGQTACGMGVIELSSPWLHRIAHELAHAAEDCAEDAAAENVLARMHPHWDERGVYADIFEAENV